MLLLNMITASLLDTHVYYTLEAYVLNQHDAYLLQAKNQMHLMFAQSSNDQWQNIAVVFGSEFKSDCQIEFDKYFLFIFFVRK